MSNSVKTGVYFCKHINGHPDSLQLDELYAFAQGMEEVAHIWNADEMDLMDSSQMAKIISDQIRVDSIFLKEVINFLLSFFEHM